ncbi:MAG: hypothetical protein QOJ72_1607 [Nocardioidaceae bacterium]|jgi:uncharacterized protein (DUF1330 family)|nr:hypothetical protein [Nocardioidaceae bacterium]
MFGGRAVHRPNLGNAPDATAVRIGHHGVMSVIALAQLTITDPDVYGRYSDRFAEVFGQFNGELLAADDNPRELEGTYPYDKAVLLRFATLEDFTDWATSPAYLEISRDRHAGAISVVVLLRGA